MIVTSSQIERISSITIKPSQVKELLTSKGLPELSTGVRANEFLKRPQITYEELVAVIGENPEVTPFIGSKVEVDVKYDGYVKRQMAQIEQTKKLEKTLIPEDIDYSEMKGLRMEAREKLIKIRPTNVGQASRISGVSPSDISSLLLELKMRDMRK